MPGPGHGSHELADGRAILEVTDDGVGMPNDVAGRVFEPFYRSSEARGRGEGTAGLGLSIVAAIAAAHGGDSRAADRTRAGRALPCSAAARGRL